VSGISLHGVDGTVVATAIHTETKRHFSLLPTRSLNNITLFSTNHVFHGCGVRVVIETGTTEDFRSGAIFCLGRVSEHKNFEWLGSLSHIPPDEATISRSGHTFNTCLLGCEPRATVDWVVMGFFEDSGVGGLNNTGLVTATQIEESESTVIHASNHDISLFVIEGHSAKRRVRFKSLLREVRIVQVPNIRLLRHVWRHLLETQLCVRNTNTRLSLIRMPNNLSSGTLNIVGVLEDHDSLG